MKKTTQMSAIQLQKLMSKIPFFMKFDGNERAQITSFAQIFIAAEGEAIIEKGSLDHCFYVMLSGSADIKVHKEDPPIATVEPGNVFGEIGFALNSPRSTWITATEICVLLQVDHKLLKVLDMGVRDKLKDQIILKLAHTIQDSNKRNSKSSK